VVIIADESADPAWIAADALATCEHDPDSWAVLLLDGERLANRVEEEIASRISALETAGLTAASWRANGRILITDSIDEAVSICDGIAPEHLQIMTRDSAKVAARPRHFGSLFIGPYAPVPFGDYVSGPNHILPTMGCARFSSGVNAWTFIRMCAFQEITEEGAAYLSPACARMADIEGLSAHRMSAMLRGGGK
jgi:histidinol dehydrogenase